MKKIDLAGFGLATLGFAAAISPDKVLASPPREDSGTRSPVEKSATNEDKREKILDLNRKEGIIKLPGIERGYTPDVGDISALVFLLSTLFFIVKWKRQVNALRAIPQDTLQLNKQLDGIRSALSVSRSNEGQLERAIQNLKAVNGNQKGEIDKLNATLKANKEKADIEFGVLKTKSEAELAALKTELSQVKDESALIKDNFRNLTESARDATYLVKANELLGTIDNAIAAFRKEARLVLDMEGKDEGGKFIFFAISSDPKKMLDQVEKEIHVMVAQFINDALPAEQIERNKLLLAPLIEELEGIKIDYQDAKLKTVYEGCLRLRGKVDLLISLSSSNPMENHATPEEAWEAYKAEAQIPKEWLNAEGKIINFFDVLEVDRSDYDDAKIKSAYRKLSLATHPDRNPNNLEAEERYKLIVEAHETLTDSTKAQLYLAALERFNSLFI